MGTVTSREAIWSWLILSPGHTAHEVARVVFGKSGPTGASVQSGSTLKLLQKMENAGQVRRETEYRAEQGREVSVWFAVPENDPAVCGSPEGQRAAQPPRRATAEDVNSVTRGEGEQRNGANHRTTVTLPDFEGTPVLAGDRVRAIHWGEIPLWLCGTTGTVVKVGRTRLHVRFDGCAYRPGDKPHSASGKNFRRLDETGGEK